MITYIITRFSIFDITYQGYKTTKKYNKNSKYDIKKYKKELFNYKRLNFKFKVFKRVTLPCVVNQTNKNYIWYIYASIYLPKEYKIKLKKLVEPYKKIKCIFIKSFREFNKFKINKKEKYCTMRLDDDDGININFIENLNKYKNKNKFIISHPYGRKYIIKKNKIITSKKKIFNKKIALGLCAINKNIYDCGNHMDIDKNYNIIYNNKPDMYYLCCSKYCDSKRRFQRV